MKQSIIIKKVKKGGHGGHHGGSWKVAYADFVTAMMAFFLLMWLITMVSPEKRARISGYFKHFSIFEKSGTAIIDGGTGAIIGEGGGGLGKVAPEMKKGEDVAPDQLKENIEREIKEKLKSLEEQVIREQLIIDISNGGVRIQLVDKESRPIFPLGGTRMSSEALEILKAIASQIKDLPNKVIIEGHTDALSYSSNKYTNWELSTERASFARKILEENGLNPDRIFRVSGYAATDPLIKDNPNDPRNRRISIILLPLHNESTKTFHEGLTQNKDLSPQIEQTK